MSKPLYRAVVKYLDDNGNKRKFIYGPYERKSPAVAMKNWCTDMARTTDSYVEVCKPKWRKL